MIIISFYCMMVENLLLFLRRLINNLLIVRFYIKFLIVVVVDYLDINYGISVYNCYRYSVINVCYGF